MIPPTSMDNCSRSTAASAAPTPTGGSRSRNRFSTKQSTRRGAMDFELPSEIIAKLAELDAFIEAEIKPLERENIQFFDHRREHARTDWEDDGRPRTEWRALISEMERRADKAGHLRYGLPKSCGGQAASNLAIAAIREHLAAKGLGLHNDLQDESSVVGNFPI